MSLLSLAERQRLITALIQAGLDVAGTRRVLLNAVDRRLVGVMPVHATPVVQLSGDINTLDNAGRLPTGEVPLEIYLTELLPLLAGEPAAESIVRLLLNSLVQRASGAPKLEPAAVPELKEKLIHGTDDTVPFAFMRAGLAVGSSVVKLLVPRHEGGVARKTASGEPLIYLGTGWLLAKNLLITNHHVINARDDGEPQVSEGDLRLQAKGTHLRLDFDSDAQAGSDAPVTQLEAWSDALDYAVLRVDLPARVPLQRGARLEPGTNPIPVNIVQHPRGHSKRYGIRNNLVSGGTARDLRYFTDTDFGSSGSPVCNDRWEVIALHRGATFVEGVQFQGKPTAYVNIGTHLDVILTDLKNRFPALSAEV
jgi:hypothetical protein